MVIYDNEIGNKKSTKNVIDQNEDEDQYEDYP